MFQNKLKVMSYLVPALIGSFLVASVIFAWTEPSSNPPGGNLAAPINVGSTSQTKAGDLTVSNLYLKNSGSYEGSIYNAHEVVGYNDLFLKGNGSENAPIYLSGSQLAFYTRVGTAPVVRMVITPGGNVEVAGQVKIAGGNPDAGKVLTSDASGLASWQTPSAATSYWTQSGSNLYPSSTTWNVGIGQTSNAKFTVGANTDSLLLLVRQPGTPNPGTAEFKVGTDGALVITAGGGISTAGSTTLVLKGGNVGIGTTSPTHRLDVMVITSGDRAIKFGSGSGTNARSAYLGAGIDTIYINDNSFNTPLVITQGSGNVGIGTVSPGYKLHVNGNLGVTDTIWKVGDYGVYLGGTNQASNIVRVGEIYGGSGFYAPNTGITLDTNAGSPFFKVSYGNISKLYIDSAGNVGIGTTAPAGKLHIKGGNLVVESSSGDRTISLGVTEAAVDIWAVGKPLFINNNDVNNDTLINLASGNVQILGDDVSNGEVPGRLVTIRGNLTVTGILRLGPQATKPSTCSIGDIYADTSGAYCACTSANTWSNMVSVGSCQ